MLYIFGPIDRQLGEYAKEVLNVYTIYEPIVFQNADNKISAWNFDINLEEKFKIFNKNFVSQTNNPANKECFGNINNKSNIYIYIIAIIIIIVLLYFFYLKK